MRTEVYGMYTPGHDITFVMEEKFTDDNEPYSLEVKGFYYGEPTDTDNKVFYGDLIAHFGAEEVQNKQNKITKENENMSTIKTTFNIKAFTHQSPQIDFRLEKVSFKFAKRIATVLMAGFRDIDITDNETGEVVFSHYVSGPFWNEKHTPGDCICEVERMLDNGEDYYNEDDED